MQPATGYIINLALKERVFLEAYNKSHPISLSFIASKHLELKVRLVINLSINPLRGDYETYF